jgi:hypothetical protein
MDVDPSQELHINDQALESSLRDREAVPAIHGIKWEAVPVGIFDLE